MQFLDSLSRRQLIVRAGRIALSGLVTLPIISSLPGCGGSGGGGTSGANDPDVNTPDPAPMFVARLAQGSTQYYDAVTGSLLPDCPQCQFAQPLALDSQVQYSIRFEGSDPSSLPPSSLSSFDPGGPPALPPSDGPGPVGTPPSPAQPQARPRDNFPIEQWFGFVYVKAGRVDEHPLRRSGGAPACVEQSVRHMHLIIKRDKGVPDDKAYTYLHIGYYQDGGNRCFVIYDKINQGICYKECFSSDDLSGGLTFLKDSLREILTDVLTGILGFFVAEYVLVAVADALATAAFPLLLALVAL